MKRLALLALALTLIPFVLSAAASPPGPAKDIVWSPDYADAMAAAQGDGKVVFIAVNMDGERANDRMAKEVYRDKRIVELSAETVNLLASAAQHKESGDCPRFDGLTCEQHRLVDIDVRKNVLKSDGTGAVVSPQHVFLSPGGEVILSVPYEISARELEWCFLEALSTVDESISPKGSPKAQKPRRLIMGDVIAQGDDVAKPITRDEALGIVAELKKGDNYDKRDALLERLATADEPEARKYILAMLRASGSSGSRDRGDSDARRGRLIRWIGVASAPTYWEICAEFVDSGAPSVKLEAAVALEQLSAEESLPTLMKAYRRASEAPIKKNLLRAIGASARGR